MNVRSTIHLLVVAWLVPVACAAADADAAEDGGAGVDDDVVFHAHGHERGPEGAEGVVEEVDPGSRAGADQAHVDVEEAEQPSPEDLRRRGTMARWTWV